MKTISATTETTNRVAEQLSTGIRTWWSEESSNWDAAVSGNPPTLPGGPDLWNRMPAVDSKAVARSTHIFERHLGIPLNTKLIRAGGYKNIEDMISHLVPAMVNLAPTE